MWQSLFRIARSLVGRSKQVRGRRKLMHRQAFFEVMESRCVLTTLWLTSSPLLEHASGGFWLGRSGDVSNAVDAHVQLSSATATAGIDFTALSTSVHFNSGQSQLWVEVQHLDDAVVESTESYMITASTTD